MIGKQTTLDLNGPILSFIQQPQSVSLSCEDVLLGYFPKFVGVATAIFPQQSPENPATNTGIVSYRWYDDNGPLFDDPPASGGDGVTIIGSATTTLSLYGNIKSKKIFLRAEYVPSAYSQPLGSAVEVETERSTGNAINEPIDSNIVDLNLNQAIILTSEPLDQTVSETIDTVFSTSASSSDDINLSYQWQFNDLNLSDGTEQKTSNTPSRSTIKITDDLGKTTKIDFNSISSYSNFIVGRTYTLVADNNTQTIVTALGGGGGSSIERSIAGGVGGFSTGNFIFLANQEYKLIVGGKGVNGGSGGFGGGGNGGSGTGVGGGGGGYTGLFLSTVSQTNAIIIAGGGGGGSNEPAVGGGGGGLNGGNSGNAGDRGGFGATSLSGGAGGFGGSSGSSLQGGAGSAGGGGGYFGGGGGTPYNGCCADGAGGGGSGFIHPTLLTNASTSVGSGFSRDGSFRIDFISSGQKIVNVTASGTRTPNLTIRTNLVGLNKIKCIITHPTACNSPVITRVANFSVLAPRQIVTVEGYNNTSTCSILYFNLDNDNYSIDSSIVDSDTICLYASEKDLEIEVDLYAAKGTNVGSFIGGEGGYSKVILSMKKNEEFIIKGIKSNTGLFLYRKGSLIAVVGQGGNAGINGNGGPGGGVNIAGGTGSGRSSGSGGQLINSGQLTTSGIFGSLSNVSTSSILPGDSKATGILGGRTISCPKGNYWISQGKSPCEDVGNVKFRLSNGTEVSNSAIINRGFKDNYSINTTAGEGTNKGGNGGNGLTGGNGGVESGGGGGSGYQDGSLKVLKSTLGGNSSTSTKIIIRSKDIVFDVEFEVELWGGKGNDYGIGPSKLDSNSPLRKGGLGGYTKLRMIMPSNYTLQVRPSYQGSNSGGNPGGSSSAILFEDNWLAVVGGGGGAGGSYWYSSSSRSFIMLNANPGAEGSGGFSASGNPSLGQGGLSCNSSISGTLFGSETGAGGGGSPGGNSGGTCCCPASFGFGPANEGAGGGGSIRIYRDQRILSGLLNIDNQIFMKYLTHSNGISSSGKIRIKNLKSGRFIDYNANEDISLNYISNI